MIPANIKNLKMYEPPLIREGDYRLFMNENLFGPSPKCIEVIQDFTKMDFCRYAHMGDYQLSERLALIDNIEADNICLNHGSSEVIKQIFAVITKENETILVPSPGWGYYKDVISLAGGISKFYYLKEEEDFKYNFDYLGELIKKENPNAVVITSPNMPTGNKIDQDCLTKLLSRYPTCYFLVDEAYWGFDGDNTLDIRMLINTYQNIIITRTFSKFFGLASERIGWLITNKNLCKVLKKVAPLFGISYSSQLIATAALESKTYYDEIRKATQKEIMKIKSSVDKLKGFYVYPSSANFVLIKVPHNQNKQIVEYMDKKGILIRDCSKYGLNSFIRISIGTPKIDKKVIEEISTYAEQYQTSV